MLKNLISRPLAVLSLVVFAFSATAQTGFIENSGLYPSRVTHYHDVNSGRLFVEPSGFTYHLLDYDAIKEYYGHNCEHHEGHDNHKVVLKGHVIRMNFVNANTATITSNPEERKSHYYNYFIGNDPSKWASDVAAYSAVEYNNVYHNIDCRLYENQGGLKYDFIVKAGADANEIQLKYEGASSIEISEEGRLIVETTLGDIVEDTPYAYQMIDGRKQEVPCHFKLKKGVVSFRFPEGYNEQYELIIDPTLIFSTYTGSTGLVSADAATYDSQGNLYASGGTFDASYPTTTGAYQQNYSGAGMGAWQVVISKFDTGGNTLLYATYIGGTTSGAGGGGGFPPPPPGPPAADYPYSLYVNSSDQLVLLAQAETTDYPTTMGCYDNTLGGTRDYVVSILSAAGNNLVASTYLGGDGDEVGNFQEMASGLILDGADNIYVAGTTNSTNFPGTGGSAQATLAGGNDGILAKLNGSLTNLVWATYIGGSGTDNATDVKIASNGDVIVVGNTSSNNFPSNGGALTNLQGNQDGFAVRLNAGGTALLNGTYIGTASKDKVKFVQIDENDEVYVLGATSSGSYPTTAGVYSSPGGMNYFVHKFTANLGATVYSTCIGGNSSGSNSELYPTAFGIDYCQNVYFTGSVISSNGGFPLTANAHTSTTRGLYICSLERDAVALEYGSYFGGNVGGASTGGQGSHYHETSNCRYDQQGILYHTECTAAGNYPMLNQAFNSQSQSNDGASFKFDFQFTEELDSLDLGPDTTLSCNVVSYLLDASGYQGVDYLWSTGDTTEQIGVGSAGTYWVMVYHACDTIYDTVTIDFAIPFQVTYTATPATCSASDGSATITITGGTGNETIEWLAPATGNTATAQNLPAGVVSVVVSGSGCTDTVDVSVGMTSTMVVLLDSINDVNCFGYLDGEAYVSVGNATAPINYVWSNSGSATNSATDLPAGTGFVIITDNAGCVDTVDYTITEPDAILVQSTIDDANCGNADGAIDITVSGGVPGYTYLYSNGNPTEDLIDVVAGTYDLTVTDNNGCTFDTTYTILDVPGPDVAISGFDVCLGDLSQFLSTVSSTSGANISSYNWTMGDGTLATGANTDHTYQNAGQFDVMLIVQDDLGCSDTATLVHQVLDIPEALFEVNAAGCAPVEIAIDNQSLNASSFEWDLGNGTTSTDFEPSSQYTQEGYYGIQLIASNAGGCSDTLILDSVVQVFPSATADFWMSTNEINQFDNLVHFFNSSSNATGYEWNFGDGSSTTNEYEPDHEFTNSSPGESIGVTLIATNAFGCDDSITKFILYKEEIIYYVPNSFTPDGDEFNQTFLPVFTSGYDPFKYHLSIYNRWGELIFESYDASIGWDGTYGGNLVQDGTYTWQITFGDLYNDENYELIGHVNLIR